MYETVVATMADGVVLQDASATILACNPAAERLLGLTAGQMTGRSSLDARWRAIREDGSPFPGEDHPVPVTLRTGLPQRDVVMGVHKPDGTLTWLSINSEPLFHVGEALPQAVVCTFTDITPLKVTQDALRRSEERYRGILETALEGVWSTDLAGTTMFANERMALMLGCTREQLASASVLDFMFPEDREHVMARLADRGRGVSETFETRFRHVDGHEVWASVATTPIVHADGTRGALAMVRDITEARRIQLEVKRLEDQLVQARKLESLGRLAGGIAHDFNNILTAILAGADFASRGASAEVREELAHIRSAAQRAGDLTRQLLAFARKQVVQLQTLDVNARIANLDKMLQRLLGEHIALAYRLEPALWPVRADPSQLEQILINLAVNAREAMPHGGPVEIATANAVAEGAEYATISVRDAGVGIDEASREHIFEPFFTTKQAGTGLGLASCHGIASQLGGRITVESGPGQGTTFTVWLPRDREPHAVPGPEARAVSTAPHGRRRLLLVEDDALLRRAVVRGLESHGYDLLVAADGEAAIEIVQRERGIDAVITDVVMPRMSGPQLADRLRAGSPGIKILFVSGYAHGGLAANEHFLEKPYSIEMLAARIEQLLAG